MLRVLLRVQFVVGGSNRQSVIVWQKASFSSFQIVVNFLTRQMFRWSWQFFLHCIVCFRNSKLTRKYRNNSKLKKNKM
jgi:hypothetical protein